GSSEVCSSDLEGSILFVSHDRQFVENIATRILEIHDKIISLFEGNYKQYKSHQSENRDPAQDESLLLETKISEVLSRLSVEPSKELEEEFQRLLKEKRKIEEQ